MKGCNKWSFDPYIPYDRAFSGLYIVRLAPNKGEIELEWRDKNPCGKHYCVYREKDGEWQRTDAVGNKVILTGLKDSAEYELYIENELGDTSETRLARTGYIPGKVINYIHPDDDVYSFSGKYVCSPSIVRLESGTLLASHDVYGHKMPQNLTILFRSDDNGESWSYVTHIMPCFWGKLFVHNGKLYMLGTSTEYGDLLIGSSEDEGRTWSMPTVIMRGSGKTEEKGPHKAPCSVEIANGRLWSAIEYGAWEKSSLASAVVSIDVNDDLMDAQNWEISELLEYDTSWENAPNVAGAIEGNVITAPDGSLYNCLRTGDHKLLLLKVDTDNPDKKEEFVKFVEFEEGHTKFEIQRHNGKYIAVGNLKPYRNRLSVLVSDDLQSWHFATDIVNALEFEKEKVAFQYPTFLYEDGELTVLSRTAFNGAACAHDSNCMTVHKLKL